MRSDYRVRVRVTVERGVSGKHVGQPIDWIGGAVVKVGTSWSVVEPSVWFRVSRRQGHRIVISIDFGTIDVREATWAVSMW